MIIIIGNYDQGIKGIKGIMIKTPQIIRGQGAKARGKMEWNGKKDWKKNC